MKSADRIYIEVAMETLREKQTPLCADCGDYATHVITWLRTKAPLRPVYLCKICSRAAMRDGFTVVELEGYRAVK